MGITNWIIGKIGALYLKTNGWKRIISYVALQVVTLAAHYAPSLPQDATYQVVYWLIQAVLAYAMAHGVLKNLTQGTAQVTPDQKSQLLGE